MFQFISDYGLRLLNAVEYGIHGSIYRENRTDIGY